MSAPVAPPPSEPVIANGSRPRISSAKHSRRATSRWTSTRPGCKPRSPRTPQPSCASSSPTCPWTGFGATIQRAAGSPQGGAARSADPPRGLPGDGRHRADRVARRRPHRRRLVLLADLADPRRRHRSPRPCGADPVRGACAVVMPRARQRSTSWPSPQPVRRHSASGHWPRPHSCPAGPGRRREARDACRRRARCRTGRSPPAWP